MNAKEGVLFIHETAGRNGAAMQLLHFLRWFKTNANRPFRLALSHGGAISGEFSNLTSIHIAEDSHWHPSYIRPTLLTSFGLKKMAQRAERNELRHFAAPCAPVLIYVNAFTSSHVRLIEMLDPKLPVLTHVHEFGVLFQRQGGADTSRLLSRTRRFVACSGAVKQSLVRNQGVPAEKIDVVHESIHVRNIRAKRSREEVFAELGFSQDAFLIAGCGRTGWNKGVDVFLQLARIVCARQPRARFIWLGPGSAWKIPELRHDAQMAGLSEKVIFTDEIPNPLDYFSAADVYALTSREDSFPLTCLEAAALGKPIVCFAGAGGMPEFVEEDCGFVVPYLDTEAMAERIISLKECPGCREKMGAAARKKVAERHDVSIAAPRILEIIERSIAQGQPA